MNPLASLSGGSGLSAPSSAAATSGDALGKSGTGQKLITFGGNPNTATGVFQNPVVLAAIVGALYLIFK